MAEYYTTLTTQGLAKVVAALRGGPVLQPHSMAVGDGGGPNFYDQYDRDALKQRSSLVNQHWSDDLNLVDVDPNNPAWIVTEGLIPTQVGGWYIREVGIFDAAGDLIAIGVYPETYKPVATAVEADLLVRSILEVGEAAAVQLKIDPSQVMATREWVLESAIPRALTMLDDAVERAEVARDIAQLAVGIFTTKQEGIDKTVADDFFWVALQNDENLVALYKNEAGVADFYGTYPSSLVIELLQSTLNDVDRRASSAAWRSAGGIAPAPYLDFGDQPLAAETDSEGRIVGGVAAVEALTQKISTADSRAQSAQWQSTTALAPAPYTYFDEPPTVAETDREGRVIGGPDAIQALVKLAEDGRYRPVPYLDYDDPYVETQVDSRGQVLASPTGTDASTAGDFSLYVDIDPDSQSVEVCWPLDDQIMQKSLWRPNGHNGVFNFRAMHKAPLGNPATAAWELVQVITTDWLPPMTIKAASDGDSGSRMATGGNHGSNGGSGLQSAEMTQWAVHVDGRRITEHTVGAAESVEVVWSNDVMAYNTMTLERYVLRQEFLIRFTRRAAEVLCDMTALEPVYLERINGAAISMAGWRESAHFFDGELAERIPYNADNPFNSGSWETAPNAWASSLYSEENGYLLQWTNRNYGIGKVENIDPEHSLQFTSSSKSYQRLIYAIDTPMLLEAGKTVSWHGGYAWASPRTFSGAIDSAFLYQINGRDRLAYAQLAGGEAVINPMNGNILTALSDDGVFGPAGLRLNNPTDYIARNLKLEKGQ